MSTVQKNGQTALHAAVQTQRAAAVVQFLADKGADLTAVDSKGETALDIAIDDGARTDSQDLLIKLMRAKGIEPRRVKP